VYPQAIISERSEAPVEAFHRLTSFSPTSPPTFEDPQP
jgi:hypothetical protein